MVDITQISFDITNSSLCIKLSPKEVLKRFEIFENIKSYLGLLPYTGGSEDTIFIVVGDITQLGVLVKEIIAILEASSLEVQFDQNITSAISTAKQAEEEFSLFKEEARRIRNAEKVLEEIPEFLSEVKSKMIRQPFKKQLLASFHIAFARNVANFSVPGTGKTTMVYTAFAAMRSANYYKETIKTILVLGPLSCFIPWKEEYIECFGKSPNLFIIESFNDIERLHGQTNPVDLILINYEKMRDGNQFQSGLTEYCRIYNTMLILDEAHRVKNPEGVYANSILPLARVARSRVVLTGTPIPQGFQDLLNITRFLYPDKKILSYSYSRLKQFTKNPTIYSREINKLISQFEPFFIRLSKYDFNINPSVDLKPIKINFSDTEQRIWNTIDAMSKDSKSRVSMIRLLQASSNPYLLARKLNLSEFYGVEENEIESENGEIEIDVIDDFEMLKQVLTKDASKVGSKIKACAQLARQLISNGEKVIIWVIFTDTALRVYRALKELNIESGALLGKSNSSAFIINKNYSRDDVIQKFKNSQKLNCVIANAAAVGESISLHKNVYGEKVCTNAIYLERNFNCAQYLQSRDRIHRVGMTDDVVVNYHFFETPGTLDGHLDESLKRKAKIMQDFIEKEPIPLILLEETDVMKEVYDSYYGTS